MVFAQIKVRPILLEGIFIADLFSCFLKESISVIDRVFVPERKSNLQLKERKQGLEAK